MSLLYQRSLSWGLDKCACIRFSRSYSVLVDHYIGGILIPNKVDFRDLGNLVDSSLKFHLHIREVFSKVSGVANNILRSIYIYTVCRTLDFMVLVFTSHIRPIINFCSILRNTGCVGNLQLLCRICTMKMDQEYKWSV